MHNLIIAATDGTINPSAHTLAIWLAFICFVLAAFWGVTANPARNWTGIGWVGLAFFALSFIIK